MKARLARITLLFVSACLLHGPVYGQNSPSQRDLEALSATIAEVQADIAATRERRDGVMEAVTAAEQDIAAFSREILEIEHRVREEQERIASLQARSETLEADRVAQQNLVAQYIRGAYRSGREEYLKLLLNQEDISRGARMMSYYRYFSEARADKIEALRGTLRELAEVRTDLEASNRRLEQQRQDLLVEQDKLQAGQRGRLALLDELDSSLNASAERLQRLQEEREEMAQLIEELTRAIADLSLGTEGQPFAELRGQLPWPVNGPLLNSYGARHELGDLNWEGVTIAAPAGSDIRAIHHGRVVFSDWFGNSGLLLIIDHGDGYMSLYANNQLLYKEVGDWVNSGEIIAAAGNTGGRRESGVYFEIRYNGESRDPISWCLPRR